ncbi:hypothetical protein [Streptomyces sp. WP-1]|uniref:hypothetical protein n=1 Tax=Streptomyces sp. WP-1 TaxID=3041497 RepID=UPI0026491E66|nr:hypothetical protein [Streptomyces sp. WP-1]WKE72094.1 hypothetical protein QHG49_25310 [Streptomyces sp. WP-1]
MRRRPFRGDTRGRGAPKPTYTVVLVSFEVCLVASPAAKPRRSLLALVSYRQTVERPVAHGDEGELGGCV